MIGPAPDIPETRFCHDVCTSLPRGVTAPIPVITTLRRPLTLIHIPSPPSTSTTSPVTNEASSEQRKRTAPATSSGVPSRASGVFARIACCTSSGRTSVSAVWMYPGATAFTRTPRGASSRASDFVKPMIPAFDAA